MIKLALLCVILGSGMEKSNLTPKVKPIRSYGQCYLVDVDEDIRYESVIEGTIHYGEDYQNVADVTWATVWVKREGKNGMMYWEFAGTLRHIYAYESNIVTGDIGEFHRTQCFYRHGEPEVFDDCPIEDGALLIGEKFKGDKE